MDLDLGPEHALLRDTVRDFMQTEVAPVVDEHERERRFPSEIVKRIGELGWLGIPIPEDEGGAGLDTLAYAIAVEEIGRVWGSLGLIVAAHTSLGCGPIHLAGTDEQRLSALKQWYAWWYENHAGDYETGKNKADDESLMLTEAEKKALESKPATGAAEPKNEKR